MHWEIKDSCQPPGVHDPTSDQVKAMMNMGLYLIEIYDQQNSTSMLVIHVTQQVTCEPLVVHQLLHSKT